MLVVVGGHSRNIGKTSVAAGLIRKLKRCQWTAVKITQYGNGVCASHSQACGCEPSGSDGPAASAARTGEPGEACALSEEYEPNTTDTGRFLAAGAERSFWLRVPAGELPRAEETLRKILAHAGNTMIESNSVLELVRPDVFLMVLDYSCRDFKASSLRFMDRADAFVVIDRGADEPVWDAAAGGTWDRKPQFLVKPPDYVTAEVSGFVMSKLSTGSAP